MHTQCSSYSDSNCFHRYDTIQSTVYSVHLTSAILETGSQLSQFEFERMKFCHETERL